jgi:1-acyl-sn-glycerol-3-phosphate acyltransferase|tara:strand:+ start:679 stop:1305 length:627 start_codon:yes stop_codon:yes gene_type:complete
VKNPHPRSATTRKLLGLLSVFVCFLLTKMTVRGKENLPKNGPYILAPNHIHNIDPFPLSAAINKPITFLMAEDQNPLKWYEGWAPRSYGVLMVNRKKIQPSTIKAMHKQIIKKEIVCIFPEGTALGSGLKKGKNGAAFFAARHEIPVIPVAISGTEKALPSLKKLKRAKITIEFGKPVFTKKENLKNLDELTKNVMTNIKEMLPKSYH